MNEWIKFGFITNFSNNSEAAVEYLELEFMQTVSETPNYRKAGVSKNR